MEQTQSDFETPSIRTIIYHVRGNIGTLLCFTYSVGGEMQSVNVIDNWSILRDSFKHENQ